MTREELVAASFDSIQRGSKSFRAASRLFDRRTKERAWLLYAWCRHCDDVCDGQDHGGAAERRAGRVADLRDKTDRAARGEMTGEVPFDALAQLLREVSIPKRLLDDHLEGFALDEAGWTPATGEDLDRYCYHVAGAVGCMMAIVMGVDPDDAPTLERAADLGIAFQLSNIARDLREDLAAGRSYVPRNWLAELAVEPASLFADRNRAALLEISNRLVERMEGFESRARDGISKLPFRSRLAVLAALRIYGAIGRRVRSLGASAWDRRVTIGKDEKLAMLAPALIEAIGRRGS